MSVGYGVDTQMHKLETGMQYARFVNFNLGILNVHSGAHGLDLAYLGCILLRWHLHLVVCRIRGVRREAGQADMLRIGSKALDIAMSSIESRHRGWSYGAQIASASAWHHIKPKPYSIKYDLFVSEHPSSPGSHRFPIAIFKLSACHLMCSFSVFL